MMFAPAIVNCLAFAGAARGPVPLAGQSRVQLGARAAPAMAWDPRQALAGAALALTLATGSADAASNAAFISTPPSVVLAAEDGLDPSQIDDLRPEQKKFLEDRLNSPQETKYETQVKGTFKDKDVTEKSKFKYSTVVVGLLLISVAAPMAQFFYYVKEDDE